MSDTRKLIDFAHDQNGSEFRDALYSAIHDKVTAHIDAKRAEIAQTLITQQEEEVEYDEDDEYESIDELSKSTLASYTGKAYKDQGARMAKAGYISGLYKAGTDKNINVKQLRKVVGKDETRKDKNRDAGVNRALGRLSKEEVDSMDEAGSPFDKDYKSQVPTKPGEKAGFTSKKVSTGTVFSRVPPKVEPTKEK
jgi:hypothetical protein